MDNSLSHTPVVLVVEDDLMQRFGITQALQCGGLIVKEAENGFQALEQYRQWQPDIVLLDVMMPGMDGFEACQALRKEVGGRHLPILMVTGLDDVASIDRAFEAGATDFVTKPLNWALLPHRVRYMLRASRATQALAKREDELIATRLEIIRRLGMAAEFRDTETGNHIIRMSQYAALIGENAGLSQQKTRLLLNAAPMHDVGKIGTPDHILLKPGRLTDSEFVRMKEHATIGGKMLAGNETALIQAAQSIALTHHERWDGSGYPAGLAGEEIPIFGRICAIADVFDALTSERPYKHAWHADDAVAEIKRSAGGQLDPTLVVNFEQVLPAVLEVKNLYGD